MHHGPFEREGWVGGVGISTFFRFSVLWGRAIAVPDRDIRAPRRRVGNSRTLSRRGHERAMRKAGVARVCGRWGPGEERNRG